MRHAVSAPGGQQADERGGAEDPGALADPLAPLGHLGLGQVDLLADQRAGLAREVLDQLADRLLAGIGHVALSVGAHGPYSRIGGWAGVRRALCTVGVACAPLDAGAADGVPYARPS